MLSPALDSVLRSRVGNYSLAAGFPYPKDIQSPLSMIMRHLNANITFPVELCLYDGAQPECLLLKTKTEYVVGLDMNYLVAIETMLRFSFSEVRIPTDAISRNFVNLISNQFKPTKFSSRNQKIQENINRNLPKLIMIAPVSAVGLEMLPYDEYYFCLYWFFVCHEFGHAVFKEQLPETIVTANAKRALIYNRQTLIRHKNRIISACVNTYDESMDKSFSKQERFSYLFDAISISKHTNIIEEIFCDQFALLMLTQAMNKFPYKGRNFDWRMFLEGLTKIFIAHISFREVRNFTSFLNEDKYTSQEKLLQLEKMNSIRFHFLRDFLAFFVGVGDDFENYKKSSSFETFGYYGQSGIRELFSDWFSMKEALFDLPFTQAQNLILDI